MSLWRTAWILGLVELLAACSPALLIDLVVPHGGYHVQHDLAYGPDPRQKLDIYVPDKLTAPAPVILFFYGGSWKGGSKSLYRAFGQAFASRGIITVIPDYRVYPQVRYPAFVEDGARAFSWLHSHAASQGGATPLHSPLRQPTESGGARWTTLQFKPLPTLPTCGLSGLI